MRGAGTPFRERRLYRPRGTLIQVHNFALLKCVRPVPPYAGVVCTDLVGSSFSFKCCCCLFVWGRYPLPLVSSVPTTRDALATAVFMRGGCTLFRERRLYRHRGTLIQFHKFSLLKWVGPVPPFAGVVSTEPAKRLFNLYLSARGLYPLTRASSVTTLWGAP